MHSTQCFTVMRVVRTFVDLSGPQLKRQQTNVVGMRLNLRSMSTKGSNLYRSVHHREQQKPLQESLLSPTSRYVESALSSSTPTRRYYSKFTAVREQTVLGSQPLCEDRAHDLIANLKDSERAAIKLALDKYEAVLQREGYEGKLAATSWRSRFGRPSKMPALGEVDPTGSFCAFPDDWLKKKAAEKVKPPTSSELLRTFFVNAVPFLAFGFLDNFTMIIAGDYIENIFGMFMCISTMAAAGLGNTISDILGIGSAFYVERACEFVGLRSPDLTPVQMEMKSCRRAANLGRMIGITVGCLIGMFPLLLMDKKSTAAESTVEETENKSGAAPSSVQAVNQSKPQ